MKYGFIRVCSATPQIRVADIKFNTEQIINAMKLSYENGSQLTVFPELCVCGYTCGDLLNQDILLDEVELAIDKIRKLSMGMDLLVFIGAPLRGENAKLFNCAVAICNGKILGVIPKTYLPNYGEFYERRHFSPAEKTAQIIKIKEQSVLLHTNILFKAENSQNFTVSAEICEDLWAPFSPSNRHAVKGANIIVNLSCSDEIVGKAEYRKNLVKMQSGKLICGYVYSDAGDGESTTDLVFSGHNIIAENGSILAESKLFENGLLYSDIDVDMLANERRKLSSGYFSESEESKEEYTTVAFKTYEKELPLLKHFPQLPFIPSGENIDDRAELILSIQAKGLEKRLLHTNAKTAVIGISGGLDSALAFLLICRAFKNIGKDFKDIIAVTMPGFGTTSRTKNNSLKLIEALGVTSKTISITDSVTQHFKDIEHDINKQDTTYENAQARMRTLILMDIANKSGGLVVGTGDLSELALGWATYNGDHMAMYGVNCSVPKTLVKYLIKYESKRIGGEVGGVLNDILNTEISPELLPSKNGTIAQKTEDLVGPYILHDFFLYYALRYNFKPEKVQYLAENAFLGEYSNEEIKKWLKVFYNRFFSQQFKRSCMPDGVKVGSVALSPRGDLRMPSDAISLIWLDNIK